MYMYFLKLVYLVYLYYSKVYPDKESMLQGALDTASLIASKSPVAVQGTKINLVFSRDHTVQEGLDFVVCILLHCLKRKASEITSLGNGLVSTSRACEIPKWDAIRCLEKWSSLVGMSHPSTEGKNSRKTDDLLCLLCTCYTGDSYLKFMETKQDRCKRCFLGYRRKQS